MASAGVAMSGHDNWQVNPASLGILTADPMIDLSMTFPTTDTFALYFDDYARASGAFSSSLHDGSLHLGVATYFARVESFEQVETSWGPGPGRTFSWTNSVWGIAAGIGWAGPVQFSLGIGAKYLRTDVDDYSADGSAFDAGAMLRWPVSLTRKGGVWLVPSAGISWLNSGSIEGRGDNDYSTPDSRRSGVAVTLMSTSDGPVSSPRLWELAVAFDHEALLYAEGRYNKRLAATVSAYDFVTLRAGDYLVDDYVWDYSYGFTINSRGLMRLLGREIGTTLWNRLSVAFSQAFLKGIRDDTLIDIGIAYDM